MHCPICQREMIPGYLQSPRDIVWSREKQSFSVSANQKNGDLIVCQGVLDGMESHFCSACGVFVSLQVKDIPQSGLGRLKRSLLE